MYREVERDGLGAKTCVNVLPRPFGYIGLISGILGDTRTYVHTCKWILEI